MARALLEWVSVGVGPEWSKYDDGTCLDDDACIKVKWKPGGLEPPPPPAPVFKVRDVDLLASKAMAAQRKRDRQKGLVSDLPHDCAHCCHWDTDPIEFDSQEHRCWEHTLTNAKGVVTKTRLSTAKQSCEQWESK